MISAFGVSDDGTVIIGIGTNPSGDTEAWMAVIPEPSTLLLATLALAGLAAYAWRELKDRESNGTSS